MRNLLNFLTTYNNIIIFLLLEAVAVYLLTTSNNYHSAVFMGGVRSVTSTIERKAGGVTTYMNLNEKNQDLADENLKLRRELESARARILRNELSDSTATELLNYEWAVARVVNNSVNKQRNFITLDKGTLDGIRPDMAVAGRDGVVGIVVAASNNFSIAMSVLNLDFRMSARLRKNGYFGSLTWDGHNQGVVLFNEIPYHVDIAPGDTVETSGLSSVFPAGLMVGVVTEVDKSGGDFYKIKIALSTEFRKLNFVYVIKNLLQDEQVQIEKEVGDG
jgi:rod shape-determining protein MreC